MNALLSYLGTVVWQGILMPCVFFGGVFFTVKSRLFQFRCLPKALRLALGTKKDRTKGGVSPFQAMCTALAGTLGTGSIVGTCQALALGGFGAVFWMWIAAFLGMIIKFFEVAIAIRTRRRTENGEWIGGPMVALQGARKPAFAALGAAFALFASLAALGMGNLAQTNSMASALLSACEGFVPLSAHQRALISVGVGVVSALLLAKAVFGGARRVGQFSERLVPIATVLFLLFATVTVLFHADRILPVLSRIVRDAFAPRAAVGAGAGIAAQTALHWGLRRSAFSNEAGLGSAAIAHACAETNDPIRQGLLGIFEVFADTLVVCTMTALAVATALPEELIVSAPAADATLISAAFATVFGKTLSRVTVAACLILFAFTTLIGWSLYGSRCAEFLFGARARTPYLVLFVLCAALGAVIPMQTVWLFSDLMNALMAIPNFIALFALYRCVLPLLPKAKPKRKEKIPFPKKTI